MPRFAVRKSSRSAVTDRLTRIRPVPILQQRQHRVQFLDRAFQFADRVGGQFLGRRQFVGVFQRCRPSAI